MRNILKDTLETGGSKVWERKIKWDITSVDRSFYVHWEAERKIDEWTKIVVYVYVQGSQNANTREGDITIRIRAILKTKVSVGFMKRFFWWLYYFFYYKKKRLQDYYIAKDMINKLKKAIGDLYGIKVEESV
jgi:hypothetical protein